MKILSLLRLVTIYLMLLASGMAWAEQSSQPLRLGIAPVAGRNQYALLEDWRIYLQHKLDRPVEFIFRDSYREGMDLLKMKGADFAWLSAPAYLESGQYAKLVATPVYHGHPLDRAYLIVSSSDLSTKSIHDLKGKIFAYVDPASNTGYLEPRYHLRLGKENPDRFFQKTFFTRDHQKIVAAVAIGLSDGGSMSGFAWETLSMTRPDITAQTRVVAKSAEYGFPPVIARRSLNKKDYASMQRILLDMSRDEEGIKLLHRLNLDGFALSDDKLYRSVDLMMQRMDLP